MKFTIIKTKQLIQHNYVKTIIIRTKTIILAIHIHSTPWLHYTPFRVAVSHTHHYRGTSPQLSSHRYAYHIATDSVKMAIRIWHVSYIPHIKSIFFKWAVFSLAFFQHSLIQFQPCHLTNKPTQSNKIVTCATTYHNKLIFSIGFIVQPESLKYSIILAVWAKWTLKVVLQYSGTSDTLGPHEVSWLKRTQVSLF